MAQALDLQQYFKKNCFSWNLQPSGRVREEKEKKISKIGSKLNDDMNTLKKNKTGKGAMEELGVYNFK